MNETFQAIAAMAQKKVKVLERSVFSYIMLACFGGLFIGVGMLTFIVIGGMLTPTEVPYIKIVQAAVFGLALCMVMLGGVDLFTGNNLVLPMGALEKRISWFSVVKVWTIGYFGKIVWAFVIAFLCSNFPPRRFSDIAVTLSVAGVTILPILLQPDLGSTLVYIVMLLAVFVVACIPWKYIWGLVGIAHY